MIGFEPPTKMDDIRFFPMACHGYCVIEPCYVDGDDIPTMISIPFVDTPEEARRKGWKFIVDKIAKFRFDSDGKGAWLCSDCAKRYEGEVQSAINSIIELGKKITPSNYELYKKCRNDLGRLGASEQQTNEFLNNLPK